MKVQSDIPNCTTRHEECYWVDNVVAEKECDGETKDCHGNIDEGR